MLATFKDKNGIEQSAERVMSGDLVILPSGDIAGLVSAEIRNPANSLGLYTPARDVFLDWAFGNDTTFSAALTAGSINTGLALDIREINSAMRSIIVQTEATTGVNYSYTVSFSRDGDPTNMYQVAAGTVTSQFIQINLDASKGYDQYVHLDITPDVAQTGTELNFKGYLTGRGG